MKYGAMFICGLVACVMAMTVITRHMPGQDVSHSALFVHPNQN
ncbi:hypothetical protein GGE67_002215 [Rhizobium leucaenae]|uniref:Uncharacterized protein n=1 Tax=Rhizobium leucaenae TaxID=29450 RepID=A0A7W6ZQK0_9HYPH|nr:hypothetical protein [Rhizobium leucaenae]MBB6301606.1 hypothetical protein [Rhizobium leucaenae]